MSPPMSASNALSYSVIAPLHNEEGNVAALHAAIHQAMQQLGGEYEIILVDDGSQDQTGVILEQLATEDPRLRALHLFRNYGQSAALSAGFAHARGEIVLTLDGDLQNDPADFPKLLAELHDPIRVVSGWRRRRQDGFLLRTLPSLVANWMIARATGIPARDTGCCLKAYRAEVVRGASLPKGMHRFLPAVLGVRAEEFVEVEVSHRSRQWGQSHYGLSRLFAVLRDLCGVPWVQRGAGESLDRPLTGALFVAAMLAGLGVGLMRSPAISDLLGGSIVAVGLLGAGYLVSVRSVVRQFARARKRGVFRLLPRDEATPVSADNDATVQEANYGRQAT